MLILLEMTKNQTLQIEEDENNNYCLLKRKSDAVIIGEWKSRDLVGLFDTASNHCLEKENKKLCKKASQLLNFPVFALMQYAKKLENKYSNAESICRVAIENALLNEEEQPETTELKEFCTVWESANDKILKALKAL